MSYIPKKVERARDFGSRSNRSAFFLLLPEAELNVYTMRLIFTQPYKFVMASALRLIDLVEVELQAVSMLWHCAPSLAQ